MAKIRNKLFKKLKKKLDTILKHDEFWLNTEKLCGQFSLEYKPLNVYLTPWKKIIRICDQIFRQTSEVLVTFPFQLISYSTRFPTGVLDYCKLILNESHGKTSSSLNKREWVFVFSWLQEEGSNFLKKERKIYKNLNSYRKQSDSENTNKIHHRASAHLFFIPGFYYCYHSHPVLFADVASNPFSTFKS